ncbi:diguanylate cyclase [Hydrogenimonas sp.]
MREKIKKEILCNLLLEVSRRYDDVMVQNAQIFEEIRYRAIHDELTGLYNRFYFMEQLKKAIAFSRRHYDYGAVIFVDLDNFKMVNDTAGHKAGDELLKLVAKKLCETMREEDIVARFGGDEFVILVENLGSDKKKAIDTLRKISGKLLSSIKYDYTFNRKAYRVTASIGIALVHEYETGIDDILHAADNAMYRAKHNGKARVVFFNLDEEGAAS